MRIELLTTGEELLEGVIADGNAAWLGRTLDAAGHRVARVTTVGDDVAAIEAALVEITGRADACVVTGGLGPTDDDVTVDALAAAAGVALDHDALTWAAIEARFGDAPIPLSNRRQARRPAGGRLYPSAVGTAPAVELVVGGCRVFCLPGVPREMRWLTERIVLPALGPGPGAGMVRRTVRLALVGESSAAARLEAGMPPGVELGWRALGPENEIKLRGPAAAVAAAAAHIDAALPAQSLGEHPSLAHATLAACAAAGLTLGAAESCTGGLVGAALTEVPGASAVFWGSVVSYANEVKQGVLGVPAAVLEAHGAVSEACAAAMAAGARAALGVDVAVSITGVAGPGGGSPDKPVGTVCFGWSGAGLDRTETRRFHGDRDRVRRFAVAWALDGVRRGIS